MTIDIRLQSHDDPPRATVLGDSVLCPRFIVLRVGPAGEGLSIVVGAAREAREIAAALTAAAAELEAADQLAPRV